MRFILCFVLGLICSSGLANQCRDSFLNYPVWMSVTALNEPVPFIGFEGVEPDLDLPIYQQDPAIWKNYLQMNLNFEPVRRLKDQMAQLLGVSLDGYDPATGLTRPRVEAHITVITPPEYNEYLAGSISMKRINEIAQEMNIQSARFEVIGVGSGAAYLNDQGEVSRDGKKQETFFIVVQSEDLLKIRRAIYREALSNPNRIMSRLGQMSPEVFFPHITIGYTFGDLHLGPHGVRKDKTSLDERFSLQLKR